MPKEVTPKASAPDKIKLALDRLKDMQKGKHFWFAHWQQVGEYFFTRKANFTTTHQEGAFLNDELFDGAGPGALMKMASALVGMMWPNGAKSFVCERARGIPDTEEVKKYYERVTEILADAMDDPRAGLQVGLDEYMLDQGGFGTSGVSCMPGKKSKLMYKAENVKFMSIDEGPDGFVDTVYLEFEWAIRKAVKEYGVDALHPETQKLFREGKEDNKVKILFCVQPRMDRDATKEGVLAMEFESLHIEVDRKHIIREGGFNELPIKVARFRKALNELYGRSPAMEALPDVQEINAIWEAVTLAIEKKLEPPIAVLDDGTLGSNQLDTSAGAINVLNISGRAGATGSPVIPIYTVEEINDAVGLIERLENSISNHFFLDRLLDFNNETQMTLGETNIRNRIRGFLLGAVFSRQIAELFSPLIERSFNLMYEMGELGVIEDSPQYAQKIADGEDPADILVIPEPIVRKMRGKDGVIDKKPPFKIKYISPAARILQSEQAQGIVQTLDFAISASQVNPEAADNIDLDKAIKILASIWGAPSEILNSDEERENIRQGREEAMQEAQLAQAAPKAADAVKKLAEANSFQLMKGRGNGKAKAA